MLDKKLAQFEQLLSNIQTFSKVLRPFTISGLVLPNFSWIFELDLWQVYPISNNVIPTWPKKPGRMLDPNTGTFWTAFVQLLATSSQHGSNCWVNVGRSNVGTFWTAIVQHLATIIPTRSKIVGWMLDPNIGTFWKAFFQHLATSSQHDPKLLNVGSYVGTFQ